MIIKKREIFSTIKTEGALLPADILQRIALGDTAVNGLSPDAYHLAAGEKLNEAINHSWNRIVGAWPTFKALLSRLPGSDIGTSVTRERWMLPLFQELGYGRLMTSKAVEIDNRSYPVSHMWQNVAIHLVGNRIDLDRRTPGAIGAARSSPHSMVQEFLNKSDDHLWAFVSNGSKLRILRNNISLTRQAYVEFDLESMMEGEVYADFVLLWLLCHESRVEAEKPEECRLERWSREAQEQGTRALEQLRNGVEEAINHLGAGLLSYPTNSELRRKLRDGELTKEDYYRRLLRIVYRLLFLFVAEDRDLLLLRSSSAEARNRFIRYYSTNRIRHLAERHRGTKHPDLWIGMKAVFKKLGSDDGYPELGLPALGSFLWSDDAVSDLMECGITNRDFLDAIRSLAFTIENNVRRTVDYKNLGSEELGSIYEALLEQHPHINLEAGTFSLDTASGHERKTSGSYYTPTSLITCLLDSALEPVVEEALKSDDPERAILDLKVCDPAAGSGHFLIAAAHRLAKHLAAVRTGEYEPSPDALRSALRDVIGHCIYGVDINPMAVELCKVNLWLEAIEPGKPLSFLDHHIKCGNSLLGTTPALLKKGIPDDAFKPITGDDKDYCTEFKRRNKKERETLQSDLFTPTIEPWERLGDLSTSMVNLDAVDDSTIMGVREKQRLYESHVHSSGYLFGHFWADAWCAAFVWKKTREFPYPITEEVFRQIEKNPYNIQKWMRDEIQRLAEQYQFFHWHLEFPDVFRVPPNNEKPDNKQTGLSGGFDVVLGNPPWEQTELKEKEFFAKRDPDIANARTGAERKRMIKALRETNPSLFIEFIEEKRKHDGISHILSSSGKNPLCGRGRINTYAIFAENKRQIISNNGRVGCIVPSGIATDDTTKFFFQSIVETQSLVGLYSFENEEFIFPAIHHATKFCLLTISGNFWHTNTTDFVFFARQVSNLKDIEKHFSLSDKDIRLINPNTRTCPIFRSKRDAELTKAVFSRVPVLIKKDEIEKNPWGISFKQGHFNMTSDSHFFKTREELEDEGFVLNNNVFVRGEFIWLPLYEGKMIWHFDSRFGTYDGQTVAQANQGKLPEFTNEDHLNPNKWVLPRYWVQDTSLPDDFNSSSSASFLVFRDITSSVVIRTSIFTIIPKVPCGNKLPIALIKNKHSLSQALIGSCCSSFVFDYITRQKLGGSNMNYFILKQLPVLEPDSFNKKYSWAPKELHQWILPRSIELYYTAWDLRTFALDCSYIGPPFKWDEDRRLLIRCELESAYFHLYGIERNDVDYIMETFPLVKQKDEQKYGSYRTKEKILEIYDMMAEAMRTGREYQTIVEPPPGPPVDADGNFVPVEEWDEGNWPEHVHRMREL